MQTVSLNHHSNQNALDGSSDYHHYISPESNNLIYIMITPSNNNLRNLGCSLFTPKRTGKVIKLITAK